LFNGPYNWPITGQAGSQNVFGPAQVLNTSPDRHNPFVSHVGGTAETKPNIEVRGTFWVVLFYLFYFSFLCRNLKHHYLFILYIYRLPDWNCIC
jgi:hypothetical protein